MDEPEKYPAEKLQYGKIISVRGSVVDVRFENNLPSVYTLLHSWKNKEISIEVLAQLDDYSVRGIALNPTQGLARGMVVEKILYRKSNGPPNYFRRLQVLQTKH